MYITLLKCLKRCGIIMIVYLPKLIDSVKMIVYGIKNKNYYWDKKWYGIKYYDKK